MQRSLLAAFSILGLLASPWGAEAAPAAERKITLIHLNDLHANLVSHLDLVRVVPEGGGPAMAQVELRGGIARIATLVKQIRRENPNSLLMNVGDTYHGGVEALYTRGNAIVPAVNALGIDVGVPGNWDFAYGAVTTRLRYQAEPNWLVRVFDWLLFDGDVERPNFPNLAANVKQTMSPMSPMSAGELLMPGTLVLETGGVRVGLIGLTSDIVPRMASPFAWGFDFLVGEDAYRVLLNDAAEQLHSEGVDVVVVMSELGLHRDRRLADVVEPGIAAFFSAHTHEVTPEPLGSRSGALVVEAGNDGYLGQMDLEFVGGELVDLRWQLLDVDQEVAEDPEVAALVVKARAPFLADEVAMDYPAPWVKLPLDRRIDTVVGHVDEPLHRRNVLHNPFNDLLASVILHEAGTQVSMTPGFRFDAVVWPSDSSGEKSGRITIEQLYRYLPIAPTLAVGEIRGADLREILEVELVRVFSPDAFEHSGGWLGSFGGLDIDLDLSKPDGQRIQSLRLMGATEPIGDDEVLTVASCVRPFDEEGIMCSNPNFHQIRELENPATGRGWTPLELLIDAFVSDRVEAATNGPPSERITDHSGQSYWPVAPYIQPLHEAPGAPGAPGAPEAPEAPEADGRVARFDTP